MCDTTVCFHHAELLAHVWFAEFGAGYPETPEQPPADDLDEHHG